MSASEGRPPTTAGRDARLQGFADRAPVERALEWVDHHALRLASEEVPLSEAVGRVPAEPIAAGEDSPPSDRAGEDGYAVRALETVGASPYNPLALRLQGAAGPLGPGRAALVSAGTALPPGADAILGFDAAQAAGNSLEVFAAVAEGVGIERAGRQLRAGEPLAGARPLRPLEVGLLASLGVAGVRAVARPRVRLVVAGARPREAGAPVSREVHLPMLRSLIARDGGSCLSSEPGAEGDAWQRALAAPGADLILATGRTGTGPDDEAPLALARAGSIALHGVALRPGGSTGMGRAGGVPVILLPGDPLACLCAYELFAGRFVRRLGGRDPELPHPTLEAEVARKIVSAIGFLDVCQVRLVAGRVEPLGVAVFGGLAAAARADGFVLVPAALEGYPPGARVTVYRY